MKQFLLKKSFNLWFTGLPSSGKTTTARALKKYLLERGVNPIILDGDEIRKGLSADLGFEEKDREENNRRIIHITDLLVRQGVPVITTFISPYTRTRELARKTIPDFIEVFVDTPIDVCISRDVKGLYAKSKRGEIKKMTGIDDVYEKPKSAEIILHTVDRSLEQNIEELVNYLLKKGYLSEL
jgi:adenylylsulfate kinase